MHLLSMFPSLRPPPLPSPRKDSRHSGCTHLQLTRLYDRYGALKCSICLKHPSFGWLYRCTQDTHGLLPESDFLGYRRRDKRKPHMDPTLHNLSPAIVRAIIQGQYTQDQIKFLVQQKEDVRLSILGDGTRPTTSASSISASESSKFSDLPESTTFSSQTSATTLNDELRAAYDWAELQKVWLSEPAHPMGQRSAIEIEREEALQSIEPPEMAPCTFKVCHTCRPAYRDRAWQSIDDVLKNPVIPPQWELDNRPISDARMVARLGLPYPKRFYADPSLSMSSSDSHLEMHCQEKSESRDSGADASMDHSVRYKSGFRTTVRNLVKGAKSVEKLSFDGPKSETDGILEYASSPSSLSRSMLFLRRRSKSPDPDSVEQGASVVGNTSLQDSLMLMLATNTPLPQGPRTPEIITHEPAASDDPFMITETSRPLEEVIAMEGTEADAFK